VPLNRQSILPSGNGKEDGDSEARSSGFMKS
jgi:hypothetical protein